MTKHFSDIIASGVLPENGEAVLSKLLEEDGRYTAQEGQHWDFKREWPFSYSDSYFGGIARLICALPTREVA